MLNRGESLSSTRDAMKIGKRRLLRCFRGLSIQIGSDIAWRILFSAIICVLAGGCAIAQGVAQPAYQQTQNPDQQNPLPDQQNGAAGASLACYLGGSGPVPGSAARNEGMALPQSALSQMQASDGQYAQQQSAYSTNQPAGYAQQGSDYSTDQPAAGQTSDQARAAMSADEII